MGDFSEEDQVDSLRYRGQQGVFQADQLRAIGGSERSEVIRSP
jgi:hypothetical protein